MSLPNLIKEAILQATISLKELNDGKIYGGVLETHLYKLARASKKELQEISKFKNEDLKRECQEIFQEAKVAYEIIRKYEAQVLNEQQVDRIRILLQRIMNLETLVGQQTQGMTRREFLRKGALATAASAIFEARAFAAKPQARPKTLESLQTKTAPGKHLYFIIDEGDENSEFLVNIIQPEIASLNPAYAAYSTQFFRLYGKIARPEGPGGGPLHYFFQNFRNEEIFKSSTERMGANDRIFTEIRYHLPESNYRLIILTTYDLATGTSEENKRKIKEVMTKRNIEVYIYGFLPDRLRYKDLGPELIERRANSQQQGFREMWNFATKVDTTANLDRTEFRRVIQEWKQ